MSSSIGWPRSSDGVAAEEVRIELLQIVGAKPRCEKIDDALALLDTGYDWFTRWDRSNDDVPEIQRPALFLSKEK